MSKAFAWLLVPLMSSAAMAATDPTAIAFGAREGVSGLSLSPDGQHVAYIVPRPDAGSALLTRGTGENDTAQLALSVPGKSGRLTSCGWVSNDRLVCRLYNLVESRTEIYPYTREIAVDAGGGNMKVLSNRQTDRASSLALEGGSVIDWLPDQQNAVLMTRNYVPEQELGSNINSVKEGLGVDRVDTKTLQSRTIEPPRKSAIDYISDTEGNVRIMAMLYTNSSGYQSNAITFLYRKPGSRDWLDFSSYDMIDQTGFYPLAVDAEKNVAYGSLKKDGHQAIYAAALDGSKAVSLVYGRPDVDVEDVIQIGRRSRVVGTSFVRDEREHEYFDPGIAKLLTGLHKALPKTPSLAVIDCSLDESRLLIFAGSDDDAGLYYLFDKPTHKLQTFLVVRPELERRTLAKMQPITFPAADGTMIPGYLSLPPGKESAKGLPAIVMPHGGPQVRDEWGFDWLVQFYVAKGYAVLQPNYRGSSGYGEAWLEKNGFQSWRTAVGDVTDAGRWLVSKGIADPSRLAIVGWSYGGYAALQSAVIAPNLFRAVVAIAPMTDMTMFKEERRLWSDFMTMNKIIGVGPHLTEGSPARNAAKIKVPVLLVHGTMDNNVRYQESSLMRDRLRDVGSKVELMTFDGLDIRLADSSARADMLEKSDAFLTASLSGR